VCLGARQSGSEAAVTAEKILDALPEEARKYMLLLVLRPLDSSVPLPAPKPPA
jgi:hypothetical protein